MHSNRRKYSNGPNLSNDTYANPFRRWLIVLQCVWYIVSTKDVLPLGHHLRRPGKTPQPRWRPKPIQLRVWFGVQEQSVLKRMPRSQTESGLDVLYMAGKIILRLLQWHRFQLKFIQSRWESSEEVDVQFLSRRCDAIFWSLGLVSCWSPLWARPGGLARP